MRKGVGLATMSSMMPCDTQAVGHGTRTVRPPARPSVGKARSVPSRRVVNGEAKAGAGCLEADQRAVNVLSAAAGKLADGIEVLDRRVELGSLVGSADLRDHPVHRWYFYKEGFSPDLAPKIVSELKVGKSGIVVDCFAGVGTTLLSLQTTPAVRRVIGIEYSPFAHFVARAKLHGRALDARRLRAHIVCLDSAIRSSRRRVDLPDLSTFSNGEIFSEGVVAQLLRSLLVVSETKSLTTQESAFFRLGIAAVIEDASNAMKDGRALRILRGRQRNPKALAPANGKRPGASVFDLIVNQWAAMAEDVAAAETAPTSPATIVRGDARDLEAATRSVLADQKVGLYLYSPPYLNCLDYSEVYKLELWLLGFITTSDEFRALRLGTLRSHPSVKFADRQAAGWGDSEVFKHVDAVTDFLEKHLPRASVGTMVGQYFRDMFETLCAQVRTLEPGGHIACVVANSTFAGRSRTDDSHSENWRLPVLTDVILARLAEAAGVTPVAIWDARSLRPRNARAGSARESVVVCRKAQ